jgi:AcrR family transcriptional regulator
MIVPSNSNLLPRGRHSLSRREVMDSQRRRLLRAMTDEVGEHGYVATSAARVYGRARVSSRAFYEQFTDKEDCFLAAYEAGVTHFIDQVMRTGTADGSDDAVAQLEQLLERYLLSLHDDPHFARAFLVEIYAVGPRALRRRAAVQQRFVQLVTATVESMLGSVPLSDHDRFAVETLVGGVTFLVTARVAAGDGAGLLALRDPLVALVTRLLRIHA